jgi:cbb3-type cytochrome oxidase maturation protein
MEILYLLIPLSVLLVFVIGGAFWWAICGGQFDDLDGPAIRILMDDDSGKILNEAVDLNQLHQSAISIPSNRTKKFNPGDE